VHTQDMEQAANVIERGAWTVEEVPRKELAVQYGYVTSPQATAAART